MARQYGEGLCLKMDRCQRLYLKWFCGSAPGLVVCRSPKHWQLSDGGAMGGWHGPRYFTFAMIFAAFCDKVRHLLICNVSRIDFI